MTDQPIPSLFNLTPLNPAFKADPHILLDDLRVRSPPRLCVNASAGLFDGLRDCG